MNEKTISFQLTEEEARNLDSLYLTNKSLASQMNALKQLATMSEDSILYYINTLVEELFKTPEQLSKYLKAIIKQDMPTIILINFLKVLYECRAKIDDYEVFRKHALVVFSKANIEHELVLKGFI
jgi:hypothetical protein